MKRSLIIIFLLGLIITSNTYSQSIGVNFPALGYLANEWMFTDAMKTARTWMTADWPLSMGQFPEEDTTLELRSDGYPVRIPEGKVVVTTIFSLIGGTYPSGDYLLLYDGTGEILVDGDPSVTSSTAGRIEFTIATPTDEGIYLYLTESDTTDPVHNIRVILPGYHDIYETQIFHPTFLSTWQKFSTFRFMETQHTNVSVHQSWTERTPKGYYSQGTKKGIAYEYIIAFANETQKDIWVNIPHLADDDFVRNFAQLFKDSLNSTSKIYIEYSNELFNPAPGFEQHEYAQQMALDSGLTSTSYNACFYYQGRRSAQVFTIIDEVFGVNNSQVIKVLGTQPDNVDGLRISLFQDNCYQLIDAVASNNYFTFSYDRYADDSWVSSLKTWDAQAVIDSSYALSDTSILYNVDLIALTDSLSLDFITYEGGQHQVAQQAYNNDRDLFDLFLAFNRQPGMYDLYKYHMNNVFNSGVSLFMHYNTCAYADIWSYWGLIEFMGQSPDSAHKYRAVVDYIDSLNNVSIKDISPIKYAPSFQTREIKVYSLNGRELHVLENKNRDVNSLMHKLSLPAGIYLIKMKNSLQQEKTFRFVKMR